MNGNSDECLDVGFLHRLIMGCIGEKLSEEERYEIIVSLRQNLIPHFVWVRRETWEIAYKLLCEVRPTTRRKKDV